LFRIAIYFSIVYIRFCKLCILAIDAIIFLIELCLLNLEQLATILAIKLILKQLVAIASLICSILVKIDYC